jgi:hypothetical protein
MNVQHSITISPGYTIEIGESSWDPADRSIRNRKTTAGGGFSPRSSSEVPSYDMANMVSAGADYDEFDDADAWTMINKLVAMLQRRHP